jgi:diguanylate cyclase (GGDEF)-like protein/PAS domain S-box-containing protein
VVTFVDITERLRSQEQQRRLSLALEKTDDAVSITDPDGTIRYVNPAFESVTGYSAAELIGRSHEVLQSGQHEPQFYAAMWETVRRGDSWSDVVINRRKNGSLYYEEKTVTPVKDDHGRIVSFVSTGKDITERREIQRRLHYLAHHDILTGLPNRAMLIDRLEHALALAGPEHIVAVLFLDVDRFKVINDTLGHHFGDDILKSLAERLEQSASKRDTVARLGGDEFAIIMEGIQATDEVAALTGRLLAGLEEPFTVSGRTYVLTASIGVSVAPMDGRDAPALLKQADIAMYRAKDAGRNRYQFYSADLGAGVLRRLNLETRLREAIEKERFDLYYQPQVDLRSGEILGVEALLRLDPGRSIEVTPYQFIPILEDTDLILAVGEWVLQKACEQARDWANLRSGLRMSVNVSGRQFADPRLVDQIDRVLEATGLVPRQLEIEMTESVLMQDDPGISRVLSALGERGVRIAIDDFGVGYSSLSYLKRFPLDTLKIDRSFVNDLALDRNARTIAQTIIAMARTLELEVVAEGVETEEQVDYLREFDCDIAQGFLFSRPESASQAERLLDGTHSIWQAPSG